MEFNAAEAMTQPNSAAGAAISTGLGAAIGMGMANRGGPWGGAARSADAPPPPPPPSVVAPLWHIAENGAATGPFAQTALQDMAAARTLTAATLVWTAGQDGWKPAGETALAALLAQVPPPPPAGS